MIFRRKRLDVKLSPDTTVALRLAVEGKDLVSALPSGFRDEVHGAHQKAAEALSLAHAAEFRVSLMEERLEQESTGTEAQRLRSLEAEFDRLAAVLRSGHNVSFHRQETNP
jgi:hypothetical protein